MTEPERVEPGEQPTKLLTDVVWSALAARPWRGLYPPGTPARLALEGALGELRMIHGEGHGAQVRQLEWELARTLDPEGWCAWVKRQAGRLPEVWTAQANKAVTEAIRWAMKATAQIAREGSDVLEEWRDVAAVDGKGQIRVLRDEWSRIAWADPPWAERQREHARSILLAMVAEATRLGREARG